MTKNLEISKTKSQNIEVRLILEKAEIVEWDTKTKKRKIITDELPSGEPKYTRNDIFSLQQLLNKFDTRKHQVREWKHWTVIKEKLYERYLHGKDMGEEKISLTIEEAAFLKQFLEELPTKEGKDIPLRENEVRTRGAVLEQLE